MLERKILCREGLENFLGKERSGKLLDDKASRVGSLAPSRGLIKLKVGVWRAGHDCAPLERGDNRVLTSVHKQRQQLRTGRRLNLGRR